MEMFDTLLKSASADLLLQTASHSGWLTKKERTQKLRYCILTNRCFFYFDNHNSKRAKGGFKLNNTQLLDSEENIIAFEAENVSHYFIASSSREAIEWKDAIQSSLRSLFDQQKSHLNDRAPYCSVDDLAITKSKITRGKKSRSVKSFFKEKRPAYPLPETNSYTTGPTFQDNTQSHEDDGYVRMSSSSEHCYEEPDTHCNKESVGYVSMVSVLHDLSLSDETEDFQEQVAVSPLTDVECARVLLEDGAIGSFMIRESQSTTTHVLCVLTDCKGTVKRYKIFGDENDIYLLGTHPHFANVEELLCFYYTNSLPNCDVYLRKCLF